MHCDTIYISFFLGCTRVSMYVSRAFLSLFKLFYVDSFVAGTSKTQEDTL